MFKNFTSFGMWFVAFCLSAGAYYVSISVSTDGLEILSKDVQRKSNNGPTLTEHLEQATAGIDQQIKSLQDAQNTSLKSKWKGTIVHEAQKTATANGKSIAQLQEQRAFIISASTNEFLTNQGNRTNEIDTWAIWVKKYGGIAEWASILLLIAMGLSEKTLVLENLQNLTSPTPPQNGTKPQTQPEYLNLGDRKPLFGNTQTVSQNNTVLQPVKAVTQQEGNEVAQSIDDTLNLARKALNSEIWNLKNENGNPATVAGRIHATFNRVGRSLSSKSTPSPDVLESYSEAFERAVQELDSKNLSYEYTNEAITQLSKYTSKAA